MTSYGWQERAACIGVSSMTSDHKERRAAAAARYCPTCPVFDACACGNLCAGRLRARERKAAVA